jgi:hypothetical protein
VSPYDYGAIQLILRTLHTLNPDDPLLGRALTLSSVLCAYTRTADPGVPQMGSDGWSMQ